MDLSSMPTDGTRAEPARDPRVAAETLALLYRQSAPASLFSVAVAGTLALALWSTADRTRLLIWLGAIGLVFVLRAGLFLAYFRARPTLARMPRWRTPYVVSLLVAGSVWGVGVPLLTPSGDFGDQALAFAFLCGMAGSALTSYSAVRAIAIATFVVTLMPITVQLLLSADPPRLAMGLGGLLFFASAYRATGILAAALHRSIQLTHELELARREAESAARTDALTGLHNRRAFTESASQAVRDCRERGVPVAALLIDIDHFKAINDSCGHASGDDVLVRIGRLLRERLRPGDHSGRLGGEEFGVLLPDTDAAAARAVAESLRQGAAQLGLRGPHGPHAVSVSIGLCTLGDDLEALLRGADLAMYRAKSDGRNRWVEAEAELVE